MGRRSRLLWRRAPRHTNVYLVCAEEQPWHMEDSGYFYSFGRDRAFFRKTGLFCCRLLLTAKLPNLCPGGSYLPTRNVLLQQIYYSIRLNSMSLPVSSLISCCLWPSERIKPSMDTFFMTYLLLYSVLRFIIEIFRGDAARGFLISGISVSQGISILMFLIGVTGFVFLRRRKS